MRQLRTLPRFEFIKSLVRALELIEISNQKNTFKSLKSYVCGKESIMIHVSELDGKDSPYLKKGFCTKNGC